MTTLLLGGTGKTGRRVADRLTALDLPVRIGSRSGEPPFDWNDPSTWAPVLEGVESVYITYYPDLAFPGALAQIQAFAELAVSRGVRRQVLLSGRGEPLAEAAEQAVRATGADLTVVRCSWFMQNFSEGFMVEPVLSGVIALPSADVPEPFVDVEDIADVVVAALTRPGHAGRLYELTGPRLLTFADVAAELSKAADREIVYMPVTVEQFIAKAYEGGLTENEVQGLVGLFTEILDGRNAQVADGVRQALGREPRDFSDYAAANAPVWTSPAGHSH
ncbi:NmrA family NAD(P)-binding protein [Nonomuraea rhizosphaerae]|uniref:NmrA family NAD(P)-binding protein n=1 Tax=Nonomuraea rhizosphaerae TaxID=2665663 RepID=UPI001C5EFE4D|nr:NmrA family NAD(P)-binding protein [Nonomuraea rhizosphaerae]